MVFRNGERMSFRDGIIFKIASPHTEKIYIGCSSLPLNRAVSGLRASAKFRKLSCNILFQAGDIQSEILEKFQDITVLEMRKKLGAIQTQYLEKCVNTNRAGRTNARQIQRNKKATRNVQGKQRHVQQETRSEEYANQGLTAETFDDTQIQHHG
ncbi:unnamed protein product [Bathycoccus prasinos]